MRRQSQQCFAITVFAPCARTKVPMEYLVELSTERTLYRMVLAAMTTVKFCEGSNLCAVIQFNELHFPPPSSGVSGGFLFHASSAIRLVFPVTDAPHPPRLTTHLTMKNFAMPTPCGMSWAVSFLPQNGQVSRCTLYAIGLSFHLPSLYGPQTEFAAISDDCRTCWAIYLPFGVYHARNQLRFAHCDIVCVF